MTPKKSMKSIPVVAWLTKFEGAGMILEFNEPKDYVHSGKVIHYPLCLLSDAIEAEDIDETT